MFSTALTGMLTGLSLIIVIGVQNALVLRQGLRREHVGMVVLVCLMGDVLLISAGTAGLGALADGHPMVLRVLGFVGAAYLLWCAWGAFRSALHPAALEGQAPRSRSSVLTTVLAVTFLNPNCYLDTVVMLGSIAASHGALKWWFALGAMTASALWFPMLGFGARVLSGPLGRASVWRVVDVFTGCVMLVVAAKLVLAP